MTMMFTDTLRLLLFPAMMAFAAFSDLFTMTISNCVSLILIVGFAVMAALTGMSGAQALLHLGAGSAVLAVGFILFACGWIGGGDAKFAASTALWLGFDPLLGFLLYASLFGGALTLLIMRFRTMPLPAKLENQEWALRLHGASAGVPYGIALAAGALAVYPDSIWMKPLGL